MDPSVLPADERTRALRTVKINERISRRKHTRARSRGRGMPPDNIYTRARYAAEIADTDCIFTRYISHVFTYVSHLRPCAYALYCVPRRVFVVGFPSGRSREIELFVSFSLLIRAIGKTFDSSYFVLKYVSKIRGKKEPNQTFVTPRRIISKKHVFVESFSLAVPALRGNRLSVFGRCEDVPAKSAYLFRFAFRPVPSAGPSSMLHFSF